MQRRVWNRRASSRFGWWVGALAAALWLVLLWGPGRPVWAQGSGDPQDAPVGAAYRGGSLFSQRCTQCHGAQGKGDGPMAAQAPVKLADFTDPAFVLTRSPQQLYDVIAEGRIENLMPPWKDSLSESEMWDAVAFIWSLHLSAADIASGQDTYDSACVSCHGADGRGDGQTTPSLAAAALLQVNEADWQTAAAAPAHPEVAGPMPRDLQLAVAVARDFSLGFTITSAQVEGDGVIVAQVRNGTTGTTPPPQKVQLLIFDSDQVVATRVVDMDASGSARFEGLPTDPAWFFVAQTEYGNVAFASDVAQFEPSTTQIDLALNAYETGATLADVAVSRAHWVVGIETADRIDVAEIYSFANTSNRVYAGEMNDELGQRVVLELLLPADATDVTFEGNDMVGRFIPLAGRVVDTAPLAPGEQQIFFRYSLPVVDGRATVSHAISYPVANLNLLVPDLGMEVETPNWVQGQSMPTQDVTFLNFVQTNLPAGAVPQAILTGIRVGMGVTTSDTEGPQQVIDPNATPGISGQPYLPLVVGGMSALVLAGGVYWVLRRQRTQAAILPHMRVQQRQALVSEIADLDDAYEAGEVSEAEYQSQRRLLKARLIALWRDETA